jgi:hypothetical protein
LTHSSIKTGNSLSEALCRYVKDLLKMEVVWNKWLVNILMVAAKRGEIVEWLQQPVGIMDIIV